jgi:integrase
MVTIRFRELNSGKYSIYLDYYATGENGKSKRHTEFLKIHVLKDYSKSKINLEDDINDDKDKKEEKNKMKLAYSVRAKRELEIAESINGYQLKKKKVKLNFLTYLDNCYEADKDRSVFRLRSTIEKYAASDIMFNDITFKWIEDFKKHLKATLAQNTQRVYLWKLKQMLEYAKKLGIIDEHNFHGVDVPGIADTEKTTLTVDEIKLLERTPVQFRVQIKQAFMFACCTGLRISDIMKLTYSEIKDNKLKFKPKKTKNKILEAPLSTQAIKILEGLEKSPASDLVFYDLPVYQTIARQMIIWGLTANLGKPLHFHAARHSFATIGLTAGIDVFTMMKLLGHSDIKQTLVYAKLVDEKKKAEVAKFPTF